MRRAAQFALTGGVVAHLGFVLWGPVWDAPPDQVWLRLPARYDRKVKLEDWEPMWTPFVVAGRPGEPSLPGTWRGDIWHCEMMEVPRYLWRTDIESRQWDLLQRLASRVVLRSTADPADWYEATTDTEDHAGSTWMRFVRTDDADD